MEYRNATKKVLAVLLILTIIFSVCSIPLTSEAKSEVDEKGRPLNDTHIYQDNEYEKIKDFSNKDIQEDIKNNLLRGSYSYAKDISKVELTDKTIQYLWKYDVNIGTESKTQTHEAFLER